MSRVYIVLSAALVWTCLILWSIFHWTEVSPYIEQHGLIISILGLVLFGFPIFIALRNFSKSRNTLKFSVVELVANLFIIIAILGALMGFPEMIVDGGLAGFLILRGIGVAKRIRTKKRNRAHN